MKAKKKVFKIKANKRGAQMNATLELQVKLIYGTERIYPINETARKMADLLGRKTLTKEDIAKLKDMGFQMVWVPITLAG